MQNDYGGEYGEEYGEEFVDLTDLQDELKLGSGAPF